MNKKILSITLVLVILILLILFLLNPNETLKNIINFLKLIEQRNFQYFNQ